MKNLISCDKPTIAALADRLKRASNHAEYQRIQCVLIRATLGSSAAQIAQLLGWCLQPLFMSSTRVGPKRAIHFLICAVVAVVVIST